MAEPLFSTHHALSTGSPGFLARLYFAVKPYIPRRPRSCYPSSLIREFLDHLSSRYKGRYWNPLARDLATWYRKEVVTSVDEANPA